MKRWTVTACIGLLCWLAPSHLQPCSVIGPRPTPQGLCDRAEVIVRAVALRYAIQPVYHDDGTWEWGQIEFEVREVIKGEAPTRLIVEGELTTQDDFNDQKVPYSFVRRGGRRGSCYARNYRGGAQFLLFLVNVDDRLSPYWAALSPTNEQLQRLDTRRVDPWLQWVRAYFGLPGD